ncbi:MAG: hypothetical protein ACLQUY_23235 [Ktedonobacterales bacterium]
MQLVSQFFQRYIAFDIAASIVIIMFILSVAFKLVNNPRQAAANLNINESLKGDKDQLKLLWDYALHSDDSFNDRQNFFLFFESVLLGGTFGLTAATTKNHGNVINLMLLLIVFLGLLTTVSWWYIQVRQEYVLDCLSEFHKRVTPVYQDVISQFRQKPYRVDSTLILVYVLPLLVGCLWAAMLLYI